MEVAAAYLYTVLEHAEVVGVREFDDFQLVILLHVLDPLVGLALWVNDERPAVCAGADQGIVGRETAMAMKNEYEYITNTCTCTFMNTCMYVYEAHDLAMVLC